jgi:hypothetical protein
MYLKQKVFEGKVYHYLDVGSEAHGRKTFRLWVNANLVKFDDDGEAYVEFPVAGKIVRTERGNLVLRSVPGWYVYDVGVGCGYRGTSEFSVLKPEGEYELFGYRIFYSPRGSLGVENRALINTKANSVMIKWYRDGRLYGDAPQGITVFYADGRVETIDEVPDGIEALKELEGDAQ